MCNRILHVLDRDRLAVDEDFAGIRRFQTADCLNDLRSARADKTGERNDLALAHGERAVSYTHLDVYKRQELHHVREGLHGKPRAGIATLDLNGGSGLSRQGNPLLSTKSSKSVLLHGVL